MLPFFLILLLSIPHAQARENDLLKCLGAEEKTLHLKNDMGPIYDLNQRLISELVQIPGASIPQNIFHDICKAPGGPSWNLLRMSILKGKTIFQLSPASSKAQTQITDSMIEDYLEATKEILINFITSIQALAPTPDCLKIEIPELDSLFTEIKYLQDEVDLKTLIEKRDKKLLIELENYPKALQRCRDRLKIKPRSGSKETKKS